MACFRRPSCQSLNQANQGSDNGRSDALPHAHSAFPPGFPNPFAASSITKTQSLPSLGGVNVRVPLPFIVPAGVALPSRGLNHQTFFVAPVILPRFILTVLFCGR